MLKDIENYQNMSDRELCISVRRKRVEDEINIWKSGDRNWVKWLDKNAKKALRDCIEKYQTMSNAKVREVLNRAHLIYLAEDVGYCKYQNKSNSYIASMLTTFESFDITWEDKALMFEAKSCGVKNYQNMMVGGKDGLNKAIDETLDKALGKTLDEPLDEPLDEEDEWMYFV